MKSYSVKKNHIGLAVSEILRYRKTHRDHVTFVLIKQFKLVEGEEIRLFNAGGEFSGEIHNQDIYFHFVGVLLDSTMHN